MRKLFSLLVCLLALITVLPEEGIAASTDLDNTAVSAPRGNRVSRFFRGGLSRFKSSTVAFYRRMRGRSAASRAASKDINPSAGVVSGSSGRSKATAFKTDGVSAFAITQNSRRNARATAAIDVGSAVNTWERGRQAARAKSNMEETKISEATAATTTDGSQSTITIAPNAQADTKEAAAATGGRTTQPTTERAAEGQGNTADPGESIQNPEFEAQDMDPFDSVVFAPFIEGAFDILIDHTQNGSKNPALKVVEAADMAKDIGMLWGVGTFGESLGLMDEDTGLVERRDMATTLMREVFGIDDAKEFAGFVTTLAVSETAKFAARYLIPVPGVRDVTDVVVDAAREGVHSMLGLDVETGNLDDIMETLRLSTEMAEMFEEKYGAHINGLSIEDRAAFMEQAAGSIAPHIRRAVLSGSDEFHALIDKAMGQVERALPIDVPEGMLSSGVRNVAAAAAA